MAGPRQGVPGAGYFRVNALQDPLGEMGRVTDAQMTAAFDHWEREKSECRRWGTEHRRARRRDEE